MKFLSSVQIHFSWWQSCLENFHMDCQVNLRRLVTLLFLAKANKLKYGQTISKRTPL